MIIEKIMYTVKCDDCGAVSGEGQEIVAWDCPGYTRELAEYDGWINKGEKDYCPECTTWNEDETELIPKKETQ